jgi:hypothetical protein
MDSAPGLSADDLYELYKLLRRRVERIEGLVRQIQSEGAHEALIRPTWTDLAAVKRDIARLDQAVSLRRRVSAAKRGK